MSEKTRRRTRRSDAEANVARIHAVTLDLLGRGRDPSMAEIAAAAGLSRQTLYSHYPGRPALYEALVAYLVAEVAGALDDELPADPAAGLEAWLIRAWQLIDDYPALLNPGLFAGVRRTDVVAEHEPITGGLRRQLDNAAEHGVLAAGASPEWLVAAVIALGHAAGQEVAAGRMSSAAAGAAFRTGVLRLCLEEAAATDAAAGRSAPSPPPSRPR
ncbi:MAG: TetR family transcriptional regulator [Streptosporangiales bacterium]|nr:TetR family transcriptional regulator [Streptosporangiales bacterium]